MPRVLLAVAALALVGAGCGAAEDDPNLAEAASKTEAAGSSRFEVNGKESVGGGATEFGCSGAADYDAKRVRMSCRLGAQGGMEVVTIGNVTYIRGDVFGFAGASDNWVRQTDDENLGDELSPQHLLAMLRAASESTERLGDEQVRGVDTVGYRLIVRCEDAQLTDCVGRTSPIDVWVADDGVVRRIALTDGGPSAFAFDFFDFGADVAIQAPAEADVVDLDQLNQPRPCRMTDGSPLTGADVGPALRRHGLDVGVVDECVGDIVAVFTSPDRSSNTAQFMHCAVSRTAASGSSFGLEGLETARVGNVSCAYSDDLAGAVDAAIAELERQIHP